MLGEGELLNVFRLGQKGDINEGDKIGEADEVVDEVIGGNKKGYPFL